MSFSPLKLGQVKPRGRLAAALGAQWDAGPAEGSPAWLRCALMVGEGRGQLKVRAWAKSHGVDFASLLVPAPLEGSWDDVDDRARSGLGWDEYVAHMVVAHPRGLGFALYGDAVVKAEVVGTAVEVELAEESEGRFEVTVYPEEPTEFTLFFRIPHWAQGCLITGEGAGAAEAGDGWAEVRRTWQRGDTLTLVFDPEGSPTSVPAAP